MKNLTEILIELAKEKEKYFKNYLNYARIIKEEAEKYLPNIKVYVFGSVVKNNFNPGSDIDVLIVTTARLSPEEKGEIKGKIYKRIGVFSPFEIHLVNIEEYHWYRNFIKENEIKEI